MGDLKGIERGAAFLDASLEEISKKLREASSMRGHRCVEVILQRGDSITPEPIRWLWPGWLAAEKLHLLAGAPGTGKTTIAISLAATVTTGGRWPDGTRAVLGRVAIWSGEDGLKDTLLPRMLAAGADMSKVLFVSGAMEGEEKRAFDPAIDIEPLRDAIVESGNVKLLVIDPIVSAVRGDSHKNAEVRRGLQPLLDLAADTGCALLGISHFSKGTTGRDPTERVTGSIAFSAAARVVMLTAKRKEEEAHAGGSRVICRSKSNIGTDYGGFAYSLEQTEVKGYPGIFASYVVWGEALEGSAREILAEVEAVPGSDDEGGGTLTDAKRFLSDLLAQAPLPVKSIKADADGAGYSWSTIRRAQNEIGVEAIKEGMKAGWVWRLPGQKSPKALKNPEDAQQNKVSAFEKFEHLR